MIKNFSYYYITININKFNIILYITIENITKNKQCIDPCEFITSNIIPYYYSPVVHLNNVNNAWWKFLKLNVSSIIVPELIS